MVVDGGTSDKSPKLPDGKVADDSVDGTPSVMEDVKTCDDAHHSGGGEDVVVSMFGWRHEVVPARLRTGRRAG